MDRLVIFVLGCVTGYLVGGYVDGLLEEDDEPQPGEEQCKSPQGAAV